jgi:Arc/MetJ-type ribon-helix-helix transcriptional regulator
MGYSFPPDLDRLIREGLASGEYASEDDLLLAAMQALRDRDEALGGIQEGLADFDAGRVQSLHIRHTARKNAAPEDLA